jgi:glyoxylate reductase
MVKIIVTRALPEVALERLGALGDVWVSTYPRPLTVQELHEAAAGASALVTMPSDRVDAALLAATGPKLKVVATSMPVARRVSPPPTRPTRSWRRPPTWRSR